MKANNLHNNRATQATLTDQPATAVAADTKAQGFRRQKKSIVSMYFDPIL
jgi:hypothetical protein